MNTRKMQYQAWQYDPNSLETLRVQKWNDWIMLGIIPLELAREYVRQGKAIVICSQAIQMVSQDIEDAE